MIAENISHFSKPYVNFKQRRYVQHCNRRAPHGQRELSETDSPAVGFRVVSVHFYTFYTWTNYTNDKEKNKETKTTTVTLPDENKSGKYESSAWSERAGAE